MSHGLYSSLVSVILSSLAHDTSVNMVVASHGSYQQFPNSL